MRHIETFVHQQRQAVITAFRLGDGRNMRIMHAGTELAIGSDTFETTAQSVSKNFVLKQIIAEMGMNIAANSNGVAQEVANLVDLPWEASVQSITFSAEDVSIHWRRADRAYPHATLTAISNDLELLVSTFDRLEVLAGENDIRAALVATVAIQAT